MKYITDYKNLKIQFRAVSFAKSSHVLEYRVDPNQDLTYKKTVGFWIFKFSLKRSTRYANIVLARYMLAIACAAPVQRGLFLFVHTFAPNCKQASSYQILLTFPATTIALGYSFFNSSFSSLITP